MFKKLFRYEFKSYAKVGFPLLIGGLLVGILIDLAIVELNLARKGMITYNFMQFLNVSGWIILLLGIFAVAALYVITAFMILKRFYDSMVKEEGYLTFTLPVETTDLILSKLLNACIWILMTAVVIGIDICGAALTEWLLNPDPFLEFIFEFVDVLDFLGGLLSMIAATLGIPVRVSVIIGFVLQAIISIPSTLMALFTIIIFVSMNVRKHRIIVMVLLYYALTFVASTAMGIFEIGSVILDPSVAVLLYAYVPLLGEAALLVGGFFATKYLCEEKLNLE